MSYSDPPARAASYGDGGEDEGVYVSVSTILDRLSRREPWEVLVWHREGASSTSTPVAHDAPRTGRTTTVQDMRMALLQGVSVADRERLMQLYGEPNARAVSR